MKLYSEGVKYVFVNGLVAYKKGDFNGSNSRMRLRKK